MEIATQCRHCQRNILNKSMSLFITAKMLLDKTYVDDTTAVLTWNSVDNPHEFSSYDRYEISCFKCDQGGDSVNHQCTESCGEKVRYWPGKEGLKDNHVTVSELEPSTLYKFVLYVWKYRTALSSVLIETSALTEVSQGKIFKIFTIRLSLWEKRSKENNLMRCIASL